MAEDVRVTRTSEETLFDDAGKVRPTIRIEFKVGTDGPFVKNFDKEGFTSFAAKQALEDFARELRAVRT
jgi:hypothetical protein